MRTTVTFDRDVEQLLRQAMHRTGQSFKVTVNQAIRKGLADMISVVEEPPFVVVPQTMKVRAGVDAVHLQRADDDLEVNAFLVYTCCRKEALENSP